MKLLSMILLWKSYTHFRDKILLIGVIIGQASYPSKLVQVKTTFCNNLLQIFYISSSQVCLCKWQCAPLIPGTRKTHRNNIITSVNSSDKNVRNIHRLAIGPKMFDKAILIPTLDLKVTVTVITDCYNRYNGYWAMNDDRGRGPVGQLLMGCRLY